MTDTTRPDGVEAIMELAESYCEKRHTLGAPEYNIVTARARDTLRAATIAALTTPASKPAGVTDERPAYSKKDINKLLNDFAKACAFGDDMLARMAASKAIHEYLGAVFAALSHPAPGAGQQEAGGGETVMLPNVGAVPVSMVGDPGILALERMASSVQIVDKRACWDHIAMFEVRDALCDRAAPAAPAEPMNGIPDECPHLIVYDDTDRTNELFAGTGARRSALKRFEQISRQWNAHLFVLERSNSRDAGYPSAFASPQAPAVEAVTDALAELMRLADCCPELNERNYDQGDVEELNAWAVETAQEIDRVVLALARKGGV